MNFGIYVHTQGPSPFREVARELGQSMERALRDITFEEIDGLFLSYQSVSNLMTGSKKLRRRVRRDYNLRLITGGTEHYRCMVEYDALVADADTTEAGTSERTLFEFVRSLVLTSLPPALAGLHSGDLANLQIAASKASMSLPARW